MILLYDALIPTMRHWENIADLSELLLSLASALMGLLLAPTHPLPDASSHMISLLYKIFRPTLTDTFMFSSSMILDTPLPTQGPLMFLWRNDILVCHSFSRWQGILLFRIFNYDLFLCSYFCVIKIFNLMQVHSNNFLICFIRIEIVI